MGSLLLPAAGSPFALMPWPHQGGVASGIWEVGLPAPLLVHLAAHLMLIQGASPRGLLPGVEFSLLGPAWSLSTEWQFYAVIAVLMTWIGNDQRGLSVLVMLFLAAAVMARGFALLAPPAWQFGRAFLPNEAAYFALGIAGAKFWRGGEYRHSCLA